MKVLLINTVCGIGSTGRIVSDLYNKYKDNGVEVKVIFGRGNAVGVNEKDAYCFNSKLDFYRHALASRLFDTQGLHSDGATRKMVALIKDFKPDIIHLHNIHGYYLNYKILFEYLNNTDIKIYWTLHDCWPFTGHCAHFTFNNCQKYEQGCNNCKHKNGYPKSTFFSNSKRNFLLKKRLFSANNNLTIITPSQWVARLVKKSFLEAKEVVVINNGVNTDVFTPTASNIKRELAIDDNKKIILGVAAPWTLKKGFDYYIRLSQAIDNERYQIVMVGLGQKQINKLPKNIIGVAKTNSIEQLAQLYTAADVFFNPTLEDNYPTVNMEAMSCNTPIVCFKDKGGGEEIVGNDGIVLESTNMDSIVLAIEQSCNKRLALNKKFDNKIMLEKYWEIIARNNKEI